MKVRERERKRERESERKRSEKKKWDRGISSLILNTNSE